MSDDTRAAKFRRFADAVCKAIEHFPEGLDHDLIVAALIEKGSIEFTDAGLERADYFLEALVQTGRLVRDGRAYRYVTRTVS